MPPLASLRSRLRELRLIQPIARRDYALLTTGSVVSLLGDGFFSVALAWQVYVGAGLLGAVLMGALLFVPGVRDPERWPIAAVDELEQTGA
jgi:hypothetical protein